MDLTDTQIRVLRQIDALPDDWPVGSESAIPESPLSRPSDAVIAHLRAHVEAFLRKPAPPVLPTLREIVTRLAPLVQPATSAEQVICLVADAMGLRPLDLLCQRKRHSHMLAWAATFWLIRTRQRKSFPEIGLAFGRSHTTVMSGYYRAVKLVAG